MRSTMSAVEAGKLFVEPALDVGPERLVLLLAPAGATPAPPHRQNCQNGRPEHDGYWRQHPREQVEARARRRRQHLLSELRHELVLDLLLRVTGCDARSNEDAHPVSHGRRGMVEGPVAGRTQRLRLELGESRVRVAARGRRRQRERQEARRREGSHPHGARAPRMPSSSCWRSTSPKTADEMCPSGLTKYVSGKAVQP